MTIKERTLRLIVGIFGVAGALAAWLPAGARDRLALMLFKLRPRRPRSVRRAYGLPMYEFVRSVFLTDRRAPLMVEASLQGGRLRLRVDLRTKSGRHYAFHGEHEPEVVAVIDQLYVPGSVALDIGANVGFFAAHLGLLADGTRGRVLAFEPLDSNYELLTGNIALNGLTGAVMPCAVGLAEREGTAAFYVNPFNDGGGGLRKPAFGASDGDRRYTAAEIEQMGFRDLEAEVVVTTLDRWLDRADVREFLGDSRTVSLVKCDVEGGELGVLRGASEVLDDPARGDRPAWIVEVSVEIPEVVKLFSAAGYGAFQISVGELSPVAAGAVPVVGNVLFISDTDDRLTALERAGLLAPGARRQALRSTS